MAGRRSICHGRHVHYSDEAMMCTCDGVNHHGSVLMLIGGGPDEVDLGHLAQGLRFLEGVGCRIEGRQALLEQILEVGSSVSDSDS
jgi:hypothetical protein